MKRSFSLQSSYPKKVYFTIEEIKNKECTSFFFGKVPIEQECYYCINCDPKKRVKLCKFCYENCHEECNELSEDLIQLSKSKPKENTAFVGYCEFACDCGIWLKHIIKPIEKKELISCPLLSIDTEFLSGQHFLCEDDQMRLCSMCYFICHKECKNKKQFQCEEGEQNEKLCDCQNSNHSVFNEFTFQIPIISYQTEMKASFWPIQMINLMFNAGTIFKELSELLKDTIVNFDPQKIYSKDDTFPYLLEQFSNTFNRKFKTFYYHKYIEDMFPFEALVSCMKRVNVKNREMALVKFRLMFILLFVHLKSDFNTIKTFTSIDFLTCSIMERLQMRKFIFTKSEYTKHIHNKYHFTNNECGILKTILINDFCPFMEIGIQKGLLNVLEFQDELEIGLKFICFLLKRMLLGINDLEILIKTLYNFHRKFITKIKFTDLDAISTWLDLFNCFAEIFYMIPANYNDLVIEEFLLRGKFKHNFIHCKSEYGQLLFKMILKSCVVISNHYKLIKSKGDFKSEEEAINKGVKDEEEKQNIKKENRQRRINPNGVEFKMADIGILTEKTIKMFHEAIRLLSVTNNTYHYQLTKLSKEIFENYYTNIEVIDSLTLFNLGDEKKPKKEPSKIHNYNHSFAYELSLSLEHLLHKFFLNSPDETTKNNQVADFIWEYENYVGKMTEHVNEYLLKTPELKEENYKFAFEILEGCEELDSFLIKNEINFNYTKLTNELKFSQIDEVSLKVLVFFSHRKYPLLITPKLTELIYSLLCLFLLTENGTRYLVSGKTLTRLNKLFHRTSLNKSSVKNEMFGLQENNMLITHLTLRFLVILSKAIKKYKIDITGHKVLLRLKKNLISHLSQYLVFVNSKNKKDKKENIEYNDHINKLKKQFNKIIKIFNYLWEFFPEKDKREIHTMILKLFLLPKNDLLNPNNFYSYYYKDFDDDKGFLESSPRIKNDEITTKRTNIEEVDFEERKKLLLSDNRYDFKKKKNNHKIKLSLYSQDKERGEIDLFFSFFKLLGKFESFILDKNISILDNLYKFFDFYDGDEKALPRLFKCGKLKLKEKTILLNFMHKIFFLEKVTKENIECINKHITAQEYLIYIIENKTNPYPSIRTKADENNDNEKYLPEEHSSHLITTEKSNILITDQNNNKPQNLSDPNYLSEIDYKLCVIKRIEFLVRIYISEIELFPFCLNDKKPSHVKSYTKNLIFGVKSICDFFYLERTLWNKPFILFYSLALEFLPKTEIFIHLLKNGIYEPRRKNNIGEEKQFNIFDKIKDPNFNIFKRDEVYKSMSDSLEFIFKKTKINYNFSLKKFLDIYDNTQEYNFTPFNLLEEKDYEYFYEEEMEESEDLNDEKITGIKDKYIAEFLDINKTNYLNVIQSVSNDSSKLNYRINIVDYFKSYLNSEVNDDDFNTLLCFMTKTLFYDTTSLQKTFKMMLNNQFFIYFNTLIQKNVYRSFIMSKNIYDSDEFITTATITKLTLQFLQLLGEEFCTDFHDKIFKKIPEDKNNETIFENIIKSLKQTIIFINLSIDIKVELPYDKLIVLMSNLVEFIIEYLVTKKEYSPILQKEMNKLFFNHPKMIDILKLRCDPKAITRMRIVSFVKVKFIQLLISYIQNGKKINTMKKLIDSNWTPIELYNEILYSFQLLIKEIEREIPEKADKLSRITNNDSYVNYLIHLYINESKFRETLQLNVCFSLYILIKIYETKYNKVDISELFKKRELEDEGENVHVIHKKQTQRNQQNQNQNDDINAQNEEEWDIYSENAFRVYKFLEQLVLFVEVKTEGTIDPTEEKRNDDDDIVLAHDEHDGKEQNANLQITFFVRPYLTYFISKQSRISFENNVDRESATAKYMGLINTSDYFLFEMIVNKRITSQSKISHFFSDFQYEILEWFNLIFIIVHNVIVIIDNYKERDLPDEVYSKQNTEEFYKFNKINFILSFIQIGYITIVLIIWFRYKFLLNFENCILKNNNMNFIYRQKSDCGQKKISKIVRSFFSDDENVSIIDVLSDVNKDIPFYSKIYIAIFESILTNREICILAYNFIFIILYFVTRSSLFIIITALFIANLSPTVFAILKAIGSKMSTYGMVLIFAYLFVYFYTWISFFWLADNFILTNVLDMETGEEITESFCYSPIQCWMLIINYGIRSGGGIADVLGMVSFRTNYKYFILRFFYDMLFHLIIILLVLNMFLAITVDAFAELRQLNGEREKDMKNICFICQLSSDYCLAKNIDFQEHIAKTHYLWNYVYFLTYLHLENVNDFNQVKKYVWDRLGNQDFSWIPLESRKGGQK